MNIRLIFIVFLPIFLPFICAIEESNNIQDLSKNMQQSIGIFPIGEIIRKANFPYLIYSESQTEVMKNVTEEAVTTEVIPKKNQSQVSTLKTLLKGPHEAIKKLSYKAIIKNLKYINLINLSSRKKIVIWEIIKTENPIVQMNTTFLKSLRGLLPEIPENDYVYFNVSDWDLINFFGTAKLLTRRRASLIAYAMKHKLGEVVIQNLEFINKLKGLICGFSQSDLRNITADTFKNIDQSVFVNLWPCTAEQIQILLDTAQKPEVYGPFELWNEAILRKIGLVITIINVGDFDRFYQTAFNGLEQDIVNLMSDDQRLWLSRKKLGSKVDKLLACYNLDSTNVSPLLNYNLCSFVVMTCILICSI